jgi:hypothetical protein
MPGLAAHPHEPTGRAPVARRPAPKEPDSPRIVAARRRAARAKGTLAIVGAVVFAAAAVLARVSYAGHPKHRPTSLAAPPAFVRIVRQNLLEAGLLAPTDAPADAATSVS